MKYSKDLPLKVAVVGAGYLGRFHAQKYAAMDGVELVAVVDTDPSRAAAVAAETGCEASTDLGAVVGRVDAASVVTPNVYHFETARPLLDAGAHVMLEKPLTTTLEQADELIALAEERGVILQAGHLERFNPAVRVMRERAKKPLFIEAHRLSGFKNRATDVDVVLDLMIHDIDIVLALVGEMPMEIRASGFPVLTPNVDIANARLAFPGGCTANLTASRVSLKDMRKFRLFEDGAYISADCATRENLIVTGRVEPGKPPAIVPEPMRHGPTDNLLEELTAFVKAVRGEGPVEVTGKEGRAALDVALRVNEAAEAARVPQKD
jgi:predicted dehydrogenase